MLEQNPHLPVEPMFSFSMTMGLLAINSAIPLHHACYSITFLFNSCYPVDLQADVPIVPTHFFINLLLRASLAHFSHFYLFWVLLAKIPIVLAHFTISFLGLPRLIYLFYSYGLFTKFFGLFQPNYYIFTSDHFLGLLAFKPTH